ncbi:MAG: DUF5640 domain-containing protein [Oscillospiraceae bacterium]|nr:DUF5640 domain-containing protein [Oscillospiraceae bacterium]
MIKKLGALLLAILIVASLTACGGNDNALVGTWSLEDSGFTAEWTFNSDGTGEAVFTGFGMDFTETITWSVSDRDALEITFPEYNEVENFTFSIDADALTMIDSIDGHERTYTRVS